MIPIAPKKTSCAALFLSAYIMQLMNFETSLLLYFESGFNPWLDAVNFFAIALSDF